MEKNKKLIQENTFENVVCKIVAILDKMDAIL